LGAERRLDQPNVETLDGKPGGVELGLAFLLAISWSRSSSKLETGKRRNQFLVANVFRTQYFSPGQRPLQQAPHSRQGELRIGPLLTIDRLTPPFLARRN